MLNCLLKRTKIFMQYVEPLQVEFARKVGPQFLTYYEKYFDVEYPLPKQDMVAIPDFNAGAMENWGLITYRYKLQFVVIRY